MRLRTLLGDHPCTAALKHGFDQVRFCRVRFRRLFADPQGLQADGARTGFRCLGDGDRHLSDGEEFWQADGAAAERGDGAISACPCTLLRRAGSDRPRDLEGKRVGIRPFTTTTGAWLRGILANDYGVDLDSIDWVTFEDAHVAEFQDTTKRAPAGKNHPDAARRRTRRGARREGRAAGPEAAVSRRRRGREIMVRQARGAADQSHGGGQPGSVADHPEAVREVYRLLRRGGARRRSRRGSARTK